jgi:hypothetical protein
MASEVRLRRFRCSDRIRALRELNDLVAVHRELMPHQVAAATGCELELAMEILLTLYDRELAEQLLLVYHNTHLDAPIKALDITEGPPALPFVCDGCQAEISDPDDLSYDFLFRLRDQVQLVVDSNAPN